MSCLLCAGRMAPDEWAAWWVDFLQEAEDHRARLALRWDQSEEKQASRFRGVSWSGRRARWRAQICVGGQRKDIGYSHSEEEAALLYDAAALHFWGPGAATNLVPNDLS